MARTKAKQSHSKKSGVKGKATPSVMKGTMTSEFSKSDKEHYDHATSEVHSNEDLPDRTDDYISILITQAIAKASIPIVGVGTVQQCLD